MKRALRSTPLRYLAVFAIAAVSALGVYLITDLSNTDFGTALGGVAAFDAALGAGAALLQTRWTRRQDMAQEYVVRANDPDIVPHNARASAFLKLTLPLEALDVDKWKARSPSERCAAIAAWRDRSLEEMRGEKLAYWKSMSQLERGELAVYPNLLEEIGVMLRLRRLDQEIVADQFRDAVWGYFTFARWFIEAERRDPNGDPQLYEEWEWLARRLAGGIYLKERRPLGYVTDSGALLEAICRSIDCRAVLYLDNVGDEEHVELFQSLDQARRAKVCRGDFYAKGPPDFHLPLAGRTADALSALARDLRGSEARIARHLFVYRRGRVLLEALNAGDGWVDVHRTLVSKGTSAQLESVLGKALGDQPPGCAPATATSA